MVITETIRKAGYCMVDGRRVPLAEVSPQRKKELQTSLVEAFISLGHSPAAARIAARDQRGNDLLGAFGLVETATTSDPLEGLTPSGEFSATRKVLQGAGYKAASRVNKTNTICFTKDGCRDVLVSIDGGWSFASTKDDSIRGTQDPFALRGNDSTTSGRNGNSLKLAFMSGLK